MKANEYVMYGSRILVLSTIFVISLLEKELPAGNGKRFFCLPILQQVTYIINDRGITKANEETSALAIFCQSILFTHGDCGLFRLPIANMPDSKREINMYF